MTIAEREPQTESSIETDLEFHVNLVIETLDVTDRKSKQTAAISAKHQNLQMVTKHLNEGWLRGGFQQYYAIRAICSQMGWWW